MSNQKKPLLEPDFDPTIPEDGVVVPEAAELDGSFGEQLPSEAEIAIEARRAFHNILPEDMIHDIVHSSNEINGSVRRIIHEHLNLGFRFGEIIRRVHDAYIAHFGGSQRASQRARNDAFAYIEKLHRISNSKVRMHLRAYAKFHSNAEAVEFLRQTDMQELLAKDLGDDIVNAVIERRKSNPEMSTREVRVLIAAYRQARDGLSATQEQLESVNKDVLSIDLLYESSKAEERRLHSEVEKIRLQHSMTLDAMDRLRNELALVDSTRSALHRQLSETERERDVALREVSEMRKQPPGWSDADASLNPLRVSDQVRSRIDTSRQLDEKIEVTRAEARVITAKPGEAEALIAAHVCADDRMDRLVSEFRAFSRRYHGTKPRCASEDSPERCVRCLDALADVVGAFYMEIEATRKAALR
ncbi:hypothetical protein [Paraburkholderia tropica]|uniref:hypothetical protein n=1 Tax=Paraburkholderia tropica TaxID=92647 RepID=UPI002AB64B1D|nr:hypothetical protein [Paraburkholderia tropica]